MLKQWMLWTSATIAMALPGAGQASDGTIGFIGAVTTPTCALIVSDVGTSLAAGCDRAVDATEVGAATLVSIYFESVSSVGHESAGIINIVYE